MREGGEGLPAFQLILTDRNNVDGEQTHMTRKAKSNKQTSSKKVKISQKNIIDQATKDLWSIGALASKSQILSVSDPLPEIIEKIVELQDRISQMKMERVAQIQARAAKATARS